MNYYLVYGRDFYDFSSTPRDTLLGITELEDRRECFESVRPKQRGLFQYNKTTYTTFYYERVRLIPKEHFEVFR
jgi:hypothetical protein